MLIAGFMFTTYQSLEGRSSLNLFFKLVYTTASNNLPHPAGSGFRPRQMGQASVVKFRFLRDWPTPELMVEPRHVAAGITPHPAPDKHSGRFIYA